MLKTYLDRFERTWNYDVSYQRALLKAAPASFLKFAVATGMVDRKAAPPAFLAAVKLAAVLAEDCGPCVQICVDMAVAEGVAPEVIRALIAEDEAAMGEDARLGWRFARASLARDMAACDPLRDEIVRRWGDKAVAAAGLALVTGRMYPTLKYAMGYGKACSKVVVAGVAAPRAGW